MYRQLAEACWDMLPSRRPSASAVADALTQQLTVLRVGALR